MLKPSPKGYLVAFDPPSHSGLERSPIIQRPGGKIKQTQLWRNRHRGDKFGTSFSLFWGRGCDSTNFYEVLFTKDRVRMKVDWMGFGFDDFHSQQPFKSHHSLCETRRLMSPAVKAFGFVWLRLWWETSWRNWSHLSGPGSMGVDVLAFCLVLVGCPWFMDFSLSNPNAVAFCIFLLSFLVPFLVALNAMTDNVLQLWRLRKAPFPRRLRSTSQEWAISTSRGSSAWPIRQKPRAAAVGEKHRLEFGWFGSKINTY